MTFASAACNGRAEQLRVNAPRGLRSMRTRSGKPFWRGHAGGLGVDDQPQGRLFAGWLFCGVCRVCRIRECCSRVQPAHFLVDCIGLLFCIQPAPIRG